MGQTRREGVEVGLRGRGDAALNGYLNYAYTRATFQERVELATPLPPGLETVPAGSSLTLVPGTPVERFLTPAPPINVLAGLRYVY